MKNPLLNKKANGFDTPAGKGKVHYDGFYPEAVGGGWNPMTDNNNLSGEISNQMGGYAAGSRGADKTKEFIDDVYRGTQEPPVNPEGKKSGTGKWLNASKKASVGREEYPIHFAIADAIGGEVDMHEGGKPIKTNRGNLYVNIEGTGMATVWNDANANESNAFYFNDVEGAIEAAKSVLPKPKKDKKLRKVPQFSEADKISLHGLGVEGSLKAAWDKAVTAGMLKFESNRYSFTRTAGEAIRAELKPTVLQVNASLNRRHVPKSASAHEAAVKVIAQNIKADNLKLDKMGELAKRAAKATHVVYSPGSIRVMRGKTIIDEVRGSKIAAQKIAEEYVVPLQTRATPKDMNVIQASKIPKCPHCGSTKYGLMPTDFETAKCKDCGKNWDHGIVPGINDPSEKTASEWETWAKTAFFSPEDAAKFRQDNEGSNVIVNEDTNGGEEPETEEGKWEPVFPKDAAWTPKTIGEWTDFTMRVLQQQGIPEHLAKDVTELTMKAIHEHEAEFLCPNILGALKKALKEEPTPKESSHHHSEDAAKFRQDNEGSSILLNEETNGGAEPDTEEDDRRWNPVKEATEEKEASWEDGLTNEDCPLPPRERCNTDDADTCCGGGFAYNDKREWVGVPCQCKDCHPPLIGNDHPHAQFIQKKFEQVSSKTASVYKVEQLKGEDFYILGLPPELNSTYSDSPIYPGMNHSLNTPESLTQGIYESLYDEFQTNDNLKDGDIFDTPVGQFICQGFEVLPHDGEAKAAVEAVNTSYACSTCGCDKADHRDGYAECMRHPDKCREYIRKAEV